LFEWGKKRGREAKGGGPIFSLGSTRGDKRKYVRHHQGENPILIQRGGGRRGTIQKKRANILPMPPRKPEGGGRGKFWTNKAKAPPPFFEEEEAPTAERKLVV